jgi:hypothetical protein
LSKSLKGFLVGIFVLVVVFVLTVLIMASVHDTSFGAEISSWFNTKEEQEEQVDTDTTEKGTTEDDNSFHTEIEPDKVVVTEDSVITVENNGKINLKIA